MEALNDIGGVLDGYGYAYGFDFRETVLADQVDADAVLSCTEMVVELCSHLEQFFAGQKAFEQGEFGPLSEAF